MGGHAVSDSLTASLALSSVYFAHTVHGVTLSLLSLRCSQSLNLSLLSLFSLFVSHAVSASTLSLPSMRLTHPHALSFQCALSQRGLYQRVLDSQVKHTLHTYAAHTYEAHTSSRTFYRRSGKDWTIRLNPPNALFTEKVENGAWSGSEEWFEERWVKFIETVNQKSIESPVLLADDTVAKVGMHVEAQVDSTRSRVVNYSKGHTGEIVGFVRGHKGKSSREPEWHKNRPVVR